MLVYFYVNKKKTNIRIGNDKTLTNNLHVGQGLFERLVPNGEHAQLEMQLLNQPILKLEPSNTFTPICTHARIKEYERFNLVAKK